MNTKILVLFTLILISCNNDSVYKNKYSKLLGIDSSAKVEIVEINDEFGGFGEGFSIEVYNLDKASVDKFLSKDNKDLPDNHNGWNKYGWDTVALDTSYDFVLAITFNRGTKNSTLSNKLETIKQKLSTEGCYYAFYYYPGLENVRKVKFFILDSLNTRFYAIESFI